MKILFINPPSAYTSYVPPLGVCYMSSILKRQGHEVIGLDAASIHRRMSAKEIAERIKDISPDVIGVTMNLYFIKGAYALMEELRSCAVPVIAGGPHARVRPEEIIGMGFDISCEGEGEEAFPEILEYLQGNRDIGDIKGITYRAKDGRIIRNPSRPLIEDLDSLPFADRELFPLDNYFLPDTLKRKNFYFQVFSSRGCPFQCTFCSVSSRRIRKRSSKNVCDEVEMLVKRYGIKHIQFMDDLFTSDRQWLLGFFDELKRRDLKINWNCEARINTVDKDLLSRMKESGMECIYYGIESADADTLKLTKKGITVEQVYNTLEATAQVDLPSVKLNFLLGFPWEKRKHILNSFKVMKRFRRRLRIRNGVATPIPYPGTKLYDEYHQEYGFTDWWLKGDAFDKPIEDLKAVPYYKKNPLLADLFWLDKNFFRHNRNFRRFLSRVIQANEKIAYRSFHGVLRTEIIYWASRISFLLYKVNPELENRVFYSLKNIKTAFNSVVPARFKKGAS